VTGTGGAGFRTSETHLSRQRKLLTDSVRACLKARLVITAVVLEHRQQAEVARCYGVSESWVSKLVARYRAEGEAAFEPRARRSHTSPTAIPATTVDLILELRDKLTPAGLEAGPDTIAWHLTQHHHTVSCYLTRAGLVNTRAEEEARVVLHQVPGTDAERDLAVRLHPLPADRHRHAPQGRRDHFLARRLHPLRPARVSAHRAITPRS